MIDYEGTKEIIYQTKMLSEDDCDFIDSSISQIQENWSKRQIFRTETEMRISVLNDVKFPTVASKYWQCIREQSVFYETLVSLSFEFRLNTIKMERLKREIAHLELEGGDNADLDIQEKQIEVERCQFGEMNMRNTAKDRMRELRLWDKLMKELVEEGPDFDKENVNSHQLISYLARWKQQMDGLSQSKSSVSEVNNLVGQYKSGLKHACEVGVILPKALQEDCEKLEVKYLQPKKEPDMKVNFKLHSFNEELR